MTITSSQLQNYINQLLSPQSFDDYCPNGIQIQGKTEIKKIAFAVSATLDSINKSIEWGADALIVHHGVFWKYQGARPVIGPWGERVRQCIKNDLTLLGYHLPLDAHLEIGNAASLARHLGLHDLEPFGEYKKTFLGVKGHFHTPMKAGDLKNHLSIVLNHDIIHASPNDEELISSMGIITGGANNEWAQCLKDGLSAYLTGEISEYNWHDSIEAGVHYYAGGHHATEKFGIQELQKRLKMNFPTLEVTYIDSENPA